MFDDASSRDAQPKLSVRIPAVAWWEARRRCWCGVIPGLSLFAEAEDFTAILAALFERLQEYIAASLQQGRERELVPRPLSRKERRRLNRRLARLEVWWRAGRFLPDRLRLGGPVMRYHVHWHPPTSQ